MTIRKAKIVLGLSTETFPKQFAKKIWPSDPITLKHRARGGMVCEDILAMNRFRNTPMAKSLNSRVAEGVFYGLVGVLLLAWASETIAILIPKFFRALNLSDFWLRNLGSAMLSFALLLLSSVAVSGSVAAFRARSFPSPTATVILITACTLRSLEILTSGNVSAVDANILGGTFFAAAFLFYGPFRLWWLILMPLAAAASFSPVIWLEFFKGASTVQLMSALWVPGGAFLAGSVVMISRELRSRSMKNVKAVETLRQRSELTRIALRSMEAEMKQLGAILKNEPVGSALFGASSVQSSLKSFGTTFETSFETPFEMPFETTDFNASPARPEPTETCSFDEIDFSLRRLLEDARSIVAGSPVKLSLTAPATAGLPIAVRGKSILITTWLKSVILNSIESLGGFPDGAVRISVRPSHSTLAISIEDNGRGLRETLCAQTGQAAERMTMAEIRLGVERSGGRYEIQSRLGVGSRVTIELPRIDAFANPPRVAMTTRAPSFEKNASISKAPPVALH